MNQKKSSHLKKVILFLRFYSKVGNYKRGKYSQCLWSTDLRANTDKLKNLNSASCTQISNPLVNLKVLNYFVDTWSDLSPLWSSFITKRTTNSCVEAWNKVVKKDIQKGKTNLKPSNVLKYLRKYTVSKMAMINISIKRGDPNNGVEEEEESWKKKQERPSYFDKIKMIEFEDFADVNVEEKYSEADPLQLDPSMAQNASQLYLTTFVIYVFYNIYKLQILDDFLAIMDENIKISK